MQLYALPNRRFFGRYAETQERYNRLSIRSYYSSDLKFDELSVLIQSYRHFIYKNHEASEDLLYFLKSAVDRNDARVFSEIIGLLYRQIKDRHEKNIAGKILLTITIYMYYLCYMETLIRPLAAEPIMALFSIDVNKIGSSISLLDICKHKAFTLLLYCNEVLTLFSTDNMMWEIMQEDEVKQLHIHSDAIEFISFYINVLGETYLTIQNELSKVDIHDLLGILEITESIVSKSDNVYVKYEQFCTWFGVNAKSNPPFAHFLKNLVIDEIRKLTIYNKQYSEARVGKLLNIKKRLVEIAEKTPVYGIPLTNLGGYDKREESIYSFEDNYSFSDQVSLFNFEEVVIDNITSSLFQRSHNKLFRVVMSSNNNVQQDYERFITTIRTLCEKGLAIDVAYNPTIYDLYKYFDNQVSENTLKEIKKISENIRTGEYWTNGTNATIYLDSTVGIPHFCLPPDFMNIEEEISDDELSSILNSKYLHKDGNYYPSAVAINLPYNYDEAMQYMRTSKFKVRFKFITFLPKHNFGFYTIYHNHDEVQL